ncbi:glycosyltransferase [Marinibacterium profundimaris]|uniref:glycosyltransferase n=1 Tax=Marinibacterium profundimaris TaxID=1679460 RepID=UPI001303D048|nr:glycosyltransferase [Marinibacterium profundimaris]
MNRALVLMWDNFGPLHQDRTRAVTSAFSDERQVTGLELCSKSDSYDWEGFDDSGFDKLTLFPGRDLRSLGTVELFRELVGAARKLGRGDYFLCHWNVKAVFLFSLWLRMTGSKVYTMGCSKFDDKPRLALKEAMKSLMFLPYNGGIASGSRSIDYFRFLGIPAEKIAGEYNTVSIERIRHLSGLESAPGGTPFEARDFICVARLVPKKNHAMLLAAYRRYCELVSQVGDRPRRLVLCGSGPLEETLKQQALDLGIADRVTFTGFVQTEEISKYLGRSLALLLPSIEEQFGNVVPEAQAAGLPVLLSDNCGARDLLVRTAVNGFIVEPDNPEGLAFHMALLSRDEDLWKRMATAASASAAGGDVTELCRAIQKLTGTQADLPPLPAIAGSASAFADTLSVSHVAQ